MTETKAYSAMLYALADEMRREEGCVTESPERVEQAATHLDELTTEIEAISAAIGKNLYLDPPDGGDVPLHEEVRRMRDSLATVTQELGELKSAIKDGVDGALWQAHIERKAELAACKWRVKELDASESHLIKERDHREKIINDLCDLVLGEDRNEWSSAYFFEDAVAEVDERMQQLAAVEKDLDEALDSKHDWVTRNVEKNTEIIVLRRKLAASQHYAQQLRDLLCKCDYSWQGRLREEVTKALSLPLDTSALDDMRAGYESEADRLTMLHLKSFQKVKELEATLDALLRNAARYDTARAAFTIGGLMLNGEDLADVLYAQGTPEQFDAAIDAAVKSNQTQEA